MSYVCFNPKCKYHIPLPDQMDGLAEVKVPNGKEVEYKTVYHPHTDMIQKVPTSTAHDVVTRHTFKTSVGDTAYFCGTCKGVLDFVHSLDEWNSQHKLY